MQRSCRRRPCSYNKASYPALAEGDERDEAYLLGVLCSIPLDWYARQMCRDPRELPRLSMPLPDPSADAEDPLRRRVEEIAGGSLPSIDARYDGVGRGSRRARRGVTPRQDRDDLVAELDALVAHLYGFDETTFE